FYEYLFQFGPVDRSWDKSSVQPILQNIFNQMIPHGRFKLQIDQWKGNRQFVDKTGPLDGHRCLQEADPDLASYRVTLANSLLGFVNYAVNLLAVPHQSLPGGS